MTNSVSGVYSITAPGGKQYIGSSVNIRKRWNTHKYHLRKGEHANSHLQNAFDKYGEDGFRFDVLIVCEKEDLIFFEQRTIDRFDPEFNQQRIAGSRLGSKHKPETIDRIRRTLIEKNSRLSDEERKAWGERVSASKTGLKREPFSEEWRRKMSESRIRFFRRQMETHRSES